MAGEFSGKAARWLSWLARAGARETRLYGRLLQPAYLRYMSAQRKRVPRAGALTHGRERALAEAVAWLYRSQDAGPERGSRCFRVATGWSACYPEVTGYNLDTLFDHQRLTGATESHDRAVEMAEWELTVQLDNGAFQSGYVDQPAVPVVFNTGQVLQGLVRAYQETNDVRFLHSARRAADWLVDVQDPDGAWRHFCFLDAFRVTDTRIAYPLLLAWKATGNEAYRAAAVRSLRYVMSVQQENGWLPHCDNSIELLDQPNTHTLAYTTEGFLESGYLLDDEHVAAAGQRTADAMLRRFEIGRVLYGRYDSEWRPTVRWTCLTGCAQSSKNWLGLYRHTGSPWYLNAALRMNDYLVACQDVNSGHPGVRGALAGSEPFGGGYQPFTFPSWATKYFCDALIAERRAVSATPAAATAGRDPSAP